MGTYKVLQDIEAEDKLLGPLTLKQFIFAIITLACAYINFLLLTRGLGLLTVVFIPPMFAFGVLAWPWSGEQTTEVWLLAKLRFLVKPRRRIWDQSGIKDLVTITAPVKDDHTYTNGLSEGEVRSRLKALANTIDSRGWAIKNVNVNLSVQPGYLMQNSSDRLIDVTNLPQQTADEDVSAADDILDEENNPTAQNLTRMITHTAATKKQNLMNRFKRASQPSADQQPTQDYWFLSQPSGPIPEGQAVFDNNVTVRPSDEPTPAPAANPQAAAQLQAAQAQSSAAYGNMRTVQPVSAAPAALPAPVSQPPTAPSSKTSDPAILELAHNDDLDVATIARQANKKSGGSDDGEVVVPLR